MTTPYGYMRIEQAEAIGRDCAERQVRYGTGIPPTQKQVLEALAESDLEANGWAEDAAIAAAKAESERILGLGY